jgi:hypothetical protein
METLKKQRLDWLKTELDKTMNNKMNETSILTFVTKLYEKAYNGLDLIKLIEDGQINVSIDKQYELLIAFNKVRKEFRNEKLLLLFMLNFIYLDNKMVLENISFM